MVLFIVTNVGCTVGFLIYGPLGTALIACQSVKFNFIIIQYNYIMHTSKKKKKQ